MEEADERRGEVRSGIVTFPPGSAGGLDGLRPQILKDLISVGGVVPAKLVDAIAGLVDHCLRGQVPPSICPLFFGATLTALKKKTGGIRPIAVAKPCRRLVAKIVLSRITPKLVSYLAPHQLGVGTKGGAEVGAHTARIYFNHPHSTPRAFLKMDFRILGTLSMKYGGTSFWRL